MAAIVNGGPRVAIYIHRLSANPTGVQRYTVELANALRDIGCAATVVTGADEGADAGTEHLQALAGSAKRRHLLWTALHRPRFERDAGPYDVVHMSSPAFAVPTRRPLVVTINDLFALDLPGYGRGPRWAFRRGVDYAVDHARTVIAPSAYTRELLLQRLPLEPDRVVVIPDGVTAGFDGDPTGSAPPRDVASGRPYVVAVGGLIPRKNLVLAIDAIEALGPSAPRLLIVGDGPDRDRLQARVDRLADPSAVRLLGRVDDATLGAVLRGALGLVHPALSEGFGLTTIEAMAAGVPVLASATGSLPEVVDDAGVLLPADDAAEWSAAISRLAADPEWRESLAARGRARAATYTWARTAKETAEVYRAAAG